MTGRAVSEAAGVAILVGITFAVTASVGVGVLFIGGGDDPGVNANFSFDHQSGQSVMLVSHTAGDRIAAGNLLLRSESNSVTWAEVANQPPNTTVGPGSPPIQLSAGSAWGSPVTRSGTIEIYYAPGDGNRTRLDSWPTNP